MKRVLCVFPLAFLLAVLTMPEAWAKARTAKIVISGGVLTTTIEVTDPRILDASNVWTGPFLDNSKAATKDSPTDLLRYEVSFYIKVADDRFRKKYVVYYYPNSASQQGYIYLPGKAETWYFLNVQSIIRDQRDGKWNYASPTWENLMKPVIASAEAAQHKGL